MLSQHHVKTAEPALKTMSSDKRESIHYMIGLAATMGFTVGVFAGGIAGAVIGAIVGALIG